MWVLTGRKPSLFWLLFLVAFFLLSVSSLHSLSEEEKEVLPELEKATLIELILRYDQGLTEAGNEMIELKSLTAEREIILTERESLLIEDRKALTIQEQIYLESLQMQKKAKIEIGVAAGAVGVAVGIIIGWIGATQ